MPANFICPNCQTANSKGAVFCNHCSQKTKLKLKSVWRMMVDFIANVIDYDSKLFSSIRGMFVPGYLTNQYMLNRRAPYLSPIRLFVFTMFATFAIMAFQDVQSNFHINSMKSGGISFTFDSEHKASDQENQQDKFYSLLERAYQELRFNTLLIRFEKELREHKGAQELVLESLNKQLVTEKSDSDKLQKTNDKITNIQAKLDNSKLSQDNFNLLRSSIIINSESTFNLTLARTEYKIKKNDFVDLSSNEIIAKYKIDGWLEKMLFKQTYKFNKESNAFISFLFQNLTWVVFLEILLMSFFYKVSYIKTKRKYVEFFIFHLNHRSFLFFVSSILLLQPFGINPWVALFVVLGIGLYLFLSMLNVYKQSVFLTLVKFAFLAVINLIVLLLSLILGLLVSSFFY